MTRLIKKWLQGIAAVLLLTGASGEAALLSPLEMRLEQDIADHRLDDFGPIEAAFILSGIDRSDTLAAYLSWYDELLQTLRDYHFDTADRVGSAAKVFSYLHANWLLDYREEATTLIDVVRRKEFNCVAGTLLFNLVCEDMGWSTEAFETPTHTYTVFPNFTEQITVENTTPMGFDIMRNLYDYSLYLQRFYPQNQVLQIGLDRLYAYENSRGRRINNTELLGLLAYNRAYFAKQNRDYARAYAYVRLAQSFNADSRSNVQFEISLYQTWGRVLFDRHDFTLAFQVMADAAYRYSDIEEFRHNSKAAYFQAMERFWRMKDWQESRRLTEELLDLEIIDVRDASHVERRLRQWREYFGRLDYSRESRESARLLQRVNQSVRTR
ncbi:hypothetical protein JW992_00960 [candidate division KSB1 bacterium]|nr:hypothetical protein [candidate division KSB1 bacterium]